MFMDFLHSTGLASLAEHFTANSGIPHCVAAQRVPATSDLFIMDGPKRMRISCMLSSDT